MQHLEVSGAVRPLKWSLGVKWLGHAKRLMSWFGLYGFQTTETPREILEDVLCLIFIVMPCP